MNLEQLRERVDELDEKILDLLNERMKLVKEIGLLKATSNTQIYRPERENYIIERIDKLNKNRKGVFRLRIGW